MFSYFLAALAACFFLKKLMSLISFFISAKTTQKRKKVRVRVIYRNIYLFREH